MNLFEEELQRRLENGQNPKDDGLDAKAYQEVFRILGKDPGYELSARFAETVVGKVLNKPQTRLANDYFWFGAGIFFLAVAFLGTVMFTGFRLDFGFLNVMADYWGLAVFGMVFIGFLNWLDKKLLKSRQVQH